MTSFLLDELKMCDKLMWHLIENMDGGIANVSELAF